MSPPHLRSPARAPEAPVPPSRHVRSRQSGADQRACARPGTLGLLLLATAAAVSAPAAAQPSAPATPASPASAEARLSLAGKWRAEPMTVRWVVGNWGQACGPRPSGGGDQGGVVTIAEQGGELVIEGEGSRFSTEQCWQMHPALARHQHSSGAGSWKTTCRSAPKDARQEILQTTVSVNGDVITLQESGQYQFVVQGQTCAASSGRWRTYRRIVEAPPPAAPPPAPAVRHPCATPGPPARIEVRPSRKLMRAGEAFDFRASVFDVQGCSLGTPVAWQLAPEGAEASIDAGRLTVARGAADAQLSVTATAASQSVRVAVDVVSDERYAALLASGGFNADGASSEAATATITSGSLGARQGAGPSTGKTSDRKWAFVIVVSVIAVSFALLGAWLLARNRRRAAPAPGRARKLPDTGTVVFTGDDAVGEPPRRLDRTRLEPTAAPAPKPATVCPVCGTMYDTRGARVCPKDGAQLLPINA